MLSNFKVRYLLPSLGLVLLSSSPALAATATTTQPHTAVFYGRITADECAHPTLPIGDAGCTITVGSRVIQVKGGNQIQTSPWGRLVGFKSLTYNYTGRPVKVYAAIVGKDHFTLEGSSRYYVRLGNAHHHHRHHNRHNHKS